MRTRFNSNIPGWMSLRELAILSSIAEYVPENGSILEVGCFLGRSTSAFYLGKKKSVSLDIVDSFKHIDAKNIDTNKIDDSFRSMGLKGNISMFETAMQIARNSNLHDSFRYCVGEEIYQNITVFETKSKDFEKNKNYNLTFIDGAHDILNVLLDLEKYDSPDQLIICDDFIPKHMEVVVAVNQCRKNRMLVVWEETKLFALVPKEGYWRTMFKENNILFL